jgi:hypothetical protein
VTDRRRTAVVLALVALALGACGTARDASDAGRPTGSLPLVPTLPATPGQTFDVRPLPTPVAWADGRRLAVTTSGSSSCPTGPADPVVVGDQELRVPIVSLFPDRDPCTADMAMTTTEVELPDGISPDEPLTVHLRYEGDDEKTVVLPPAGE